MKKLNYLFVIAAVFMISCGGSDQASNESTEAPKSMVAEEKPVDPMENKGIGPISSVVLASEIDTEMVGRGQVLYDAMCTACHKPDVNYIGPAPKGIMSRRSPEWIMNMILDPEKMVKEDPVAKELLKRYLAPMANQSLTEDEARKILEYFRTLE